MSKARLVITAVTVQGLSQAQTARRYGVSKSWVSKLLARYRLEGETAFEPRSRRPHTTPNALPHDTVEAILTVRDQLTKGGHDVGPETIAWHLRRHHQLIMARATIARVPTRNGRVARKKRKRDGLSA